MYLWNWTLCSSVYCSFVKDCWVFLMMVSSLALFSKSLFFTFKGWFQRQLLVNFSLNFVMLLVFLFILGAFWLYVNHWCRLGPSKRVQSSNLSKSTRQNNGKLDVRLVEQVQVEPRVPRSYAIVCCLAPSLSLIDMCWFSIWCAIFRIW